MQASAYVPLTLNYIVQRRSRWKYNGILFQIGGCSTIAQSAEDGCDLTQVDAKMDPIRLA